MDRILQSKLYHCARRGAESSMRALRSPNAHLLGVRLSPSRCCLPHRHTRFVFLSHYFSLFIPSQAVCFSTDISFCHPHSRSPSLQIAMVTGERASGWEHRLSVTTDVLLIAHLVSALVMRWVKAPDIFGFSWLRKRLIITTNPFNGLTK